MPANYVLLEKITVGAAGASSITFSSIPQTGYTDLVVKASIRTGRAVTNSSLSMRFNGDSGSNYSNRLLSGDGTSVTSVSSGAVTRIQYFYAPGSTATSSTFSNMEIYIPNYTSSNYKSVNMDSVTENNATTVADALAAGLWSSTAAITSIFIDEPFGSSSFQQYSTFYLYGVAKLGTTPAIVPYATGGDTIMTDGTYWYHAFLSSGTFTPAKGLSCDVLVVAGGGGSGASSGGNYTSGGGGAGGYLKSTGISVSSAATVTVGAGGAAVSVGTNNGNAGSNSQFGSVTASVGGGWGGANSGGGGNTGGSGGGASVGATGAAGTSGQGFAGGNGGPGAANYTGGGGGGAGAVGAAGTSSNGGAGGVGKNTDSSWLSVVGMGVSGYLAGGGGGGSWGAGLGGAGGSGGGGLGGGNSTQGAGVAGTANTGSGAGGGGNGYNGASGGSGLVIVRYAV